MRNGTADIYAAASNNGPWTNVSVVTGPGNQTSPAIAAEATGSMVHLLWVDDASGNLDIFYAGSNGLTGTPLTGTNIIDDTTGADQTTPAIAVTGSGSTAKVFACWQDKRNVSGLSQDTDLYFVQVNAGKGTNIFVGDDSTNSNQASPAMAIDTDGFPFIIWGDDRSSRSNIYYADSTYIQLTPVASENITAAAGATIGTDAGAITSIEDASITIPPDAAPCDLKFGISKVENPPKLSRAPISIQYEFSPSGVTFSQPVTVTIPYTIVASKQPSAYWYNVLTGELSQQGISDIKIINISPTLGALQFKTTHLTQFVVGEAPAIDAVSSDSGGGGGGFSLGCSLTPAGQANPLDFFLPYIGLGVVMVIIRLRDVRSRRNPQIKGKSSSQ
jgi:hypothetical protein